MSELIFLAEDAPERGYTARALGQSVFTGADTLRANIRGAVGCHFERGQASGSHSFCSFATRAKSIVGV